jgi:hypothetical protein
MRRLTKRYGSTRANRIEVDIRHALQQRQIIQQSLRRETSLPETADAVVFAIRPARERLVNAPHVPTDAAQSFAPFRHVLPALHFIREAKNLTPSLNDLVVRPSHRLGF